MTTLDRVSAMATTLGREGDIPFIDWLGTIESHLRTIHGVDIRRVPDYDFSESFDCGIPAGDAIRQIDAELSMILNDDEDEDLSDEDEDGFFEDDDAEDDDADLEDLDDDDDDGNDSDW